MKNGKTPGIDGFPSKFFKVYCPKLKYFILRAINFSSQKGELPLSLRHYMITGLPKGNKDRKFLQNWHPISLLSVIYKIASAIVNRL